MESIADYFKPPYVRINSNHLRIKPAVDQCHKILESRTAEELHRMAQILDEIFPEPENLDFQERNLKIDSRSLMAKMTKSNSEARKTNFILPKLFDFSYA